MSTPRTSVKMAAFAPMPSASVMTTTDVNPGDLRSCRRANFRSFMLFSAQCFYWINMRGAARRYKTRDERGGDQDHTRGDKGERIAGADFVQDFCENAAGCQ